MTVIPSPGKLGAGSPLSTCILLGFLETFGNRTICDISTISRICLPWLMGSKIIVDLGEKERNYVASGAWLCFPLCCHRPEKLFRSFLITIPAIPVLKALRLKSSVFHWHSSDSHSYKQSWTLGSGSEISNHWVWIYPVTCAEHQKQIHQWNQLSFR